MTAYRIAKGLWIASAVAVLGVTLYFGDPEADILIVWSMLVLGFPGSVLAMYCYAGLVIAWQNYVASPATLDGGRGIFYLSATLLWTAFFLAGYAQWFLLLPFLVRKWRAARARH